MSPGTMVTVDDLPATLHAPCLPAGMVLQEKSEDGGIVGPSLIVTVPAGNSRAGEQLPKGTTTGPALPGLIVNVTFPVSTPHSWFYPIELLRLLRLMPSSSLTFWGIA